MFDEETEEIIMFVDDLNEHEDMYRHVIEILELGFKQITNDWRRILYEAQTVEHHNDPTKKVFRYAFTKRFDQVKWFKKYKKEYRRDEMYKRIVFLATNDILDETLNPDFNDGGHILLHCRPTMEFIYECPYIAVYLSFCFSK